MIRKVARHLPHYLSLIGIFVFACLAFFVFPYDRWFQVSTAIAVSVAYVVWGVVHHAIHKDLYLVTIIEYIIVSVLGLLLILSLIFRA